MRLFLLAFAGALGTLARYGVYVAATNFTKVTGFPIATVTVNLVGSALLGFFGTIVTDRLPTTEMRLLVGVGFMGAFTTFSTFEFDSLRLIEDRAFAKLGLYLFSNLVVGLGAVILGRMLALKLNRG